MYCEILRKKSVRDIIIFFLLAYYKKLYYDLLKWHIVDIHT